MNTFLNLRPAMSLLHATGLLLCVAANSAMAVPQPAINACNGLSTGDSCSFTTPNGTLSGTCALNDTQLACAPESQSGNTSSSGETAGLLINEAGTYAGYTLFAPLTSTTSYLIDNQGEWIHSWASNYNPGNSVYLLENGNLLRTGAYQGNSTMSAGGAGGIVQEMAWNGSVLWEYTYADTTHRQHHDVAYLPNGHILMIAWELKTYAEATAAGRNPGLLTDNELWPDHIIEVEPAGNTIVWEWHVWDHLIQDYDPAAANYGNPAEQPGRIDLNFAQDGKADWNHINSIDYNPDLDQILVSVHNFSEIWIIDHNSTTEQARGAAGDLLYRWGNPAAYGAGTANDQQLYSQHDAQWIEDGLPGAGNILLYNNGMTRGYSSVDEIQAPLNADGSYALNTASAYAPDAPLWTYTAANPTDFYSASISGAQRLPNGNTLICEGESGNFFEVTAAGHTVWQYVNPVSRNGIAAPGESVSANSVFRALRYAGDYPGLAGTGLNNVTAYYDSGTATAYLPEVDAGRLGTYRVNLQFISENPIVFNLDLTSGVTPISAVSATAASFDPDTGVLDIPTLSVGTEQYQVRLQLQDLPGLMRFELVSLTSK